MQIAVWIGLGVLAGWIARLSTAPDASPPPLLYLPTDDDSVAVLVRPERNKQTALLPYLLGTGAAVGAGWLSTTYELGRLLGLETLN